MPGCVCEDDVYLSTYIFTVCLWVSAPVCVCVWFSVPVTHNTGWEQLCLHVLDMEKHTELSVFTSHTLGATLTDGRPTLDGSCHSSIAFNRCLNRCVSGLYSIWQSACAFLGFPICMRLLFSLRCFWCEILNAYIEVHVLYICLS